MFEKIAENINILFNEKQQFHPQFESFNLKGKSITCLSGQWKIGLGIIDLIAIVAINLRPLQNFYTNKNKGISKSAYDRLCLREGNLSFNNN